MATRLTTRTRRVLACLLEADEEIFVDELGRAAGLATGTVYPVLAGFELDGWVESHWDGDESAETARRVYRLTEAGRVRGWNALQVAR